MGNKIKFQKMVVIGSIILINSCGEERIVNPNSPAPQARPQSSENVIPSPSPSPEIVNPPHLCGYENNGILWILNLGPSDAQYYGYSTNFDGGKIKEEWSKTIPVNEKWYYSGVETCSQNDIEGVSGHYCHSYCDANGNCTDNHHKLDTKGCKESPKPSPSPTVEPSPKPTPSPTPTPSPSPTPTPCPKKSWGKCK